MTSKNFIRIFDQANKKGFAVAGLVVLGWEDAIAYTEAANETGIPIILQAGPGCRKHTPIPILGKMFNYLAEQTKTPIVCHIDHGYSYRECVEGMDNGFTSVMFDGSKLPIKENIKITKSIVKKAQLYNVSVEGEVGFVGYNKGKKSLGTDLNEARLFSYESGADSMAISVGNTHLQTKKIAKINLEKIYEIQDITPIPLVLHGGSGIADSLKKKIARNTNVAKFNIGTELRRKFGDILRKNINSNKKIFDRIEMLKPTIKEITKLTKKIIVNIGPK
tara:strand:+ start:137 stop:967 length:831 start_codon:yes stop_codon:yes gene_type:complete